MDVLSFKCNTNTTVDINRRGIDLGWLARDHQGLFLGVCGRERLLFG